MTQLFLIRHGEVAQPYQGVFAGRTDVELSENGKKQARITAKYLLSQHISTVYSSPMKRVRQTVEEFEKLSLIQPVFIDELVEIDFGAWTGLTFDEVSRRFNVSAYSWLEQLEYGSIPGAETATQLKDRIKVALDKVLLQSKDRNVAIFCHGGIIRVIMSELLDIPLVKFGKIGIDYCSVNKVCVNERGASLRLLNYVPWKNGVPI